MITNVSVPECMLLRDAYAFPTNRKLWAVEVKWDGMRAMLADGRIYSRHGRDWSDQFPELLEGVASLPAGTVLDGELIVSDQSLDDLMRRLRCRHEERIERAVREMPARLVLFDVLALGGRDVCQLPYSERRRLLESVTMPNRLLNVTPSYPAAHAEDVWAMTEAQGWEGVVFKRLTSRYVPGGRSHDWLRMKHPTG